MELFTPHDAWVWFTLFVPAFGLVSLVMAWDKHRVQRKADLQAIEDYETEYGKLN